jgi:hypothetical protein
VSSSEKALPDDALIKAVLGKSHHRVDQYSEDDRKLFGAYHRIFKLGSKPVAHLTALAGLTDEELLANMPSAIKRLINEVETILKELPE